MSDPLNRSMSDPFKEFVEEMPRLAVPEARALAGQT
jgi:hypothetical protein